MKPADAVLMKAARIPVPLRRILDPSLRVWAERNFLQVCNRSLALDISYTVDIPACLKAAANGDLKELERLSGLRINVDCVGEAGAAIHNAVLHRRNDVITFLVKKVTGLTLVSLRAFRCEIVGFAGLRLGCDRYPWLHTAPCRS